LWRNRESWEDRNANDIIDPITNFGMEWNEVKITQDFWILRGALELLVLCFQPRCQINYNTFSMKYDEFLNGWDKDLQSHKFLCKKWTLAYYSCREKNVICKYLTFDCICLFWNQYLVSLDFIKFLFCFWSFVICKNTNCQLSSFDLITLNFLSKLFLQGNSRNIALVSHLNGFQPTRYKTRSCCVVEVQILNYWKIGFVGIFFIYSIPYIQFIKYF